MRRSLYDTCSFAVMSSFTQQRSEASLTEREGPPQTLSCSSINYWAAVVSWKASQTFRWSVWWIFQLTNRPPDTPHQSNVWLERGHAFWPQSGTCACTCIYGYSVAVVAILLWMLLVTVCLHYFPPRTLCGGICVDYKQTKITCFLNIYVDTTRWRKMLL